MPRTPRGARAPGFTLVELIVAMAVFAILATLAVPAFATYFEKARLRGAADAVVALVADARLAAVAQGRAVSVTFVGEGAQWCVGAREAQSPSAGMPLVGMHACDCTGAGDACEVDARRAVVSSAMHSGVVLVAPVGAVAFQGATGLRADPSNGVARLASRTGRFAMTLAISPLGQVSICGSGGAMSGVPSC